MVIEIELQIALVAKVELIEDLRWLARGPSRVEIVSVKMRC